MKAKRCARDFDRFSTVHSEPRFWSYIRVYEQCRVLSHAFNGFLTAKSRTNILLIIVNGSLCYV
jgi:hypothetical protein